MRGDEKKMTTFIPVLSTPSGRSLTVDNWQEIGINAICYYLDDLLIKPGLAILNSIDNLKHYLGWPSATKLILNATLLAEKEKNIYLIRSPYDGSKILISTQEIISLLNFLQPDYIILPQSFNANNIEQLSENIEPVFFASSLFVEKNNMPLSAYWQGADITRVDNKFRTTYIFGNFSYKDFIELKKYGIDYIESDQPAKDAVNGLLYIVNNDANEILNLKQGSSATEQSVIDSCCSCPTCEEGYTRAYLHHLLLNVPFLCMRFLIQHNIYSAYNFRYHSNSNLNY